MSLAVTGRGGLFRACPDARSPLSPVQSPRDWREGEDERVCGNHAHRGVRRQPQEQSMSGRIDWYYFRKG